MKYYINQSTGEVKDGTYVRGCMLHSGQWSLVGEEDRKTVLLRATMYILRKCHADPSFNGLFEQTVVCDGVECTVMYLADAIADELGEDTI